MKVFKNFQKKVDKCARNFSRASFDLLKCPRVLYNTLKLSKKRFPPSEGVGYQ
eukprot:UN10903